MTQFQSQHPGGSASILRWGGLDAGGAFSALSIHGTVTQTVLKGYYVGDYCSTSPCPTTCSNGVGLGGTGTGTPTPTPTPYGAPTPPTPVPAPTPGGTAIPTLSWAQVATHNQLTSLYIVIRKKVYDMTNYRQVHPGGPFAIQRWGGLDCTGNFDLIGMHSTVSAQSLQTYFVANIGAASAFPPSEPKLQLLGPGPTGGNSSFGLFLVYPTFAGDGGTTSCNVQFKLQAAADSTYASVPTFPNYNTTDIQHRGLSPSTAYTYRASCSNGHGTSPFSALLNIKTIASGPVTLPRMSFLFLFSRFYFLLLPCQSFFLRVFSVLPYVLTCRVCGYHTSCP